MKKTYQGSCHCGSVRFEADIDLAQGTSKCNCSICTKTRFWKAIVTADSFRLLAGEDALSEYRFGSNSIQHRFCRTCGVKPFGRGNLPDIGEFYAIAMACLDSATPAELAEAPVRFEDGRHERWEAAPDETRYL
jgi:hypothetical protein